MKKKQNQIREKEDEIRERSTKTKEKIFLLQISLSNNTYERTDRARRTRSISSFFSFDI